MLNYNPSKPIKALKLNLLFFSRIYIKLLIEADSFLSINVLPKQIFLHNKYINNNSDYECIINILYLLLY